MTMCARRSSKLAAFVDGEVRGEEVLIIARHVAECRACADEVEALRTLGDELRGAAATLAPPMSELDGLADGVISRVRAEDQQSWGSKLGRAVEDFHWIAAGAGAVAAAVVSAVIVCGLVEASVPERGDSLAALMRPDQVEAPVAASQARHGIADIVQAVNELADEDASTVVTDRGRVQNPQVLPFGSRKDVDAVLGELSRMGMDARSTGASSGVWLLTKVRVKIL